MQDPTTLAHCSIHLVASSSLYVQSIGKFWDQNQQQGFFMPHHSFIVLGIAVCRLVEAAPENIKGWIERIECFVLAPLALLMVLLGSTRMPFSWVTYLLLCLAHNSSIKNSMKNIAMSTAILVCTFLLAYFVQPISSLRDQEAIPLCIWSAVSAAKWFTLFVRKVLPAVREKEADDALFGILTTAFVMGCISERRALFSVLISAAAITEGVCILQEAAWFLYKRYPKLDQPFIKRV